jgi:hypothetical protein
MAQLKTIRIVPHIENRDTLQTPLHKQNNMKKENNVRTCYGEPCFQLKKDSSVGYCTRINVYIHVDHAKRERLCDFEDSRGTKQSEKEASGMVQSNDSSSENSFYAGILVKTTQETFDKIKHYILTQTDANLIYQTKSVRYLKIEPVDPPPTTTPAEDREHKTNKA